MKVVKLTAPWNHDFYAQTPGGKGIYGDYKFEINNDCVEADYWIVYGGLRSKKDKTLCPSDGVFYLTDECHNGRFFNKFFLNQFPLVITPRNDINHLNIIHHHEINTWSIKRSFEDINGFNNVKKTKNLSVVVSDTTDLPGHKKRFALINKLIGHFKDKLDVFGRGFNPIDDKAEALLPYKYSISIENSNIKDYFTEKFYDCLLCHTMPIYYGCPNIETFFDRKSFLKIDLDDYVGTIRLIEEAIDNNLYESSLEYILQAKNNYLNQLHLFPGLVNVISNIRTEEKKREITLRHETAFQRGYHVKKLLMSINNILIPNRYKFQLNFMNQPYANK